MSDEIVISIAPPPCFKQAAIVCFRAAEVFALFSKNLYMVADLRAGSVFILA
jgi:hypothetical protein